MPQETAFFYPFGEISGLAALDSTAAADNAGGRCTTDESVRGCTASGAAERPALLEALGPARMGGVDSVAAAEAPLRQQLQELQHRY